MTRRPIDLRTLGPDPARRAREIAARAQGLDHASTTLLGFYTAAGAGPSLPPVPPALAAEVDKVGARPRINAHKGGKAKTTV